METREVLQGISDEFVIMCLAHTIHLFAAYIVKSLKQSSRVPASSHIRRRRVHPLHRTLSYFCSLVLRVSTIAETSGPSLNRNNEPTCERVLMFDDLLRIYINWSSTICHCITILTSSPRPVCFNYILQTIPNEKLLKQNK